MHPRPELECFTEECELRALDRTLAGLSTTAAQGHDYVIVYTVLPEP